MRKAYMVHLLGSAAGFGSWSAHPEDVDQTVSCLLKFNVSFLSLIIFSNIFLFRYIISQTEVNCQPKF